MDFLLHNNSSYALLKISILMSRKHIKQRTSYFGCREGEILLQKDSRVQERRIDSGRDMYLKAIELAERMNNERLKAKHT